MNVKKNEKIIIMSIPDELNSNYNELKSNCVACVWKCVCVFQLKHTCLFTNIIYYLNSV